MQNVDYTKFREKPNRALLILDGKVGKSLQYKEIRLLGSFL